LGGKEKQFFQDSSTAMEEDSKVQNTDYLVMAPVLSVYFILVTED